jgi:hypothetical protein
VALSLDNSRKKELAGVAPMGRDRRVMPRYAFTAAAEALDQQSRSRMTARTSDISRGGCYVDTFCPFPRNANLKIRILRKNEHLIADAKVAYSTVGMGMGLCFTALAPDQQRVLDRWIGELSGETKVEFDENPQAAAPELESKPREESFTPRQITPQSETSLVLGELILALIRRNALSSVEGHALLLKLTKSSPLL